MKVGVDPPTSPYRMTAHPEDLLMVPKNSKAKTSTSQETYQNGKKNRYPAASPLSHPMAPYESPFASTKEPPEEGELNINGSVRLNLHNKGALNEPSHISLPVQQDLKEKEKHAGGKTAEDAPTDINGGKNMQKPLQSARVRAEREAEKEEGEVKNLVDKLLDEHTEEEYEEIEETREDGSVMIVKRSRKRRGSKRTSLLERRESEVQAWAMLSEDDDDKNKKDGSISSLPSQFFMTKLGYCCACFPILQPNHPWVERWDLIMCALLTYVAAVAPYDTAFLNTKVDTVFFLNRIVDVGFVVDMCLQFNLAFPGRYGRFIKDRSEIVHHYLKTWFLIDIVSICPFDTMAMAVSDTTLGSLQGLRIVRLLRLFKMLRLLRANRMFSRFEARMAINYSLLQLYGFLMMLFLLCHWLACGWYMVVMIEENEECIFTSTSEQAECCTSWFDCYRFIDVQGGQTAARKYFLSLWWSTAEVLTVSSDIYPVTDTERAYQIVVRILAGIVYAYLIGAVCSIFTTLSKDQTKFFEDMDSLNSFLRSQHVDQSDEDLCASLRMFFRYAHTCSGSTSSMKEILRTISPNLRGRLAFRVHSQWLKQMRLFKDASLSHPFYVSLALALEQRIFAPLENIIEPHDKSNSLFIVEKGMVLSKGKVKTVGDCFGEDSVWAWREDTIRGYQATAFTHGKVNVLRSADMFEILARPQFKVESFQIRKRVIRAQCCELACTFHKVLLEATTMSDFPRGCNLVRERLQFVKADALGVIFEIFSRVWKKAKPNDKSEKYAKLIGGTLRERQVANQFLKIKKRNEAKRMMEALEKMLSNVGLESLAHSLVEEHEMDMDLLMEVSAEQLHAMGAPMAKAIRFRKFVEQSNKLKEKGEVEPAGIKKNQELEEVKSMLADMGMQDYAWNLVMKEHMTVGLLLEASIDQLHAVGLPMGKAMRFSKLRDDLMNGDR